MTDFTQDADEGVNAQDADDGIDAGVESELRAHAGKIERILTSKGFPPHVIGSAINDAALALRQERKRGKHVANPKAFMITVAIRSAINALRPIRETNEIPGSDVISDIPDRADDLSLKVMLQEDVGKGLEQLSPRRRQALTLCIMRDLSIQDAAREAGITPAAMETNLRRGREDLRQIMEAQGYQPRKREQEEGGQPRKEATR